MNNDDKSLMDHYGVTTRQSTVYMYLGNKYEKLQDALNYAKIVTARKQSSANAKR